MGFGYGVRKATRAATYARASTLEPRERRKAPVAGLETAGAGLTGVGHRLCLSAF